MKKINILGSCVSRVSLLNGNTSGHGIYGEDMKISNFMRMPMWIWYPYADLFF